MAGPAATIGSMHTCPMVTGTVPHVGGPVIGPGVPTVLIGGKPAAVMGDSVTCAGPPDTIVQGESTVLIGGKPAATVGSMTAHGGVISVGESTVLIGTGGSGASATMAVSSIPFPDISFVSKVLASVVGQGDSLAEAQANQEEIRSEAENNEGEPIIYNVRWTIGDQIIRGTQIFKEATIKASVLNIEDGESLTFSVKRPSLDTDDDGNTTEVENDVVELTGTVQNKEVEVTWEVEKNNEEENS